METSDAGGVGKHRNSQSVSGFWIDDNEWWSVITDQQLTSVCRADCHTSVNTAGIDDYAKENRT